jgi:hypothetical protein
MARTKRMGRRWAHEPAARRREKLDRFRKKSAIPTVAPFGAPAATRHSYQRRSPKPSPAVRLEAFDLPLGLAPDVLETLAAEVEPNAQLVSAGVLATLSYRVARAPVLALRGPTT